MPDPLRRARPLRLAEEFPPVRTEDVGRGRPAGPEGRRLREAAGVAHRRWARGAAVLSRRRPRRARGADDGGAGRVAVRARQRSSHGRRHAAGHPGRTRSVPIGCTRRARTRCRKSATRSRRAWSASSRRRRPASAVADAARCADVRLRRGIGVLRGDREAACRAPVLGAGRRGVRARRGRRRRACGCTCAPRAPTRACTTGTRTCCA